MEGRYLDAYRVATFHTALGATIKTASLAIGGIVAFLSLMYMLVGPNVIGVGLGFFGIVMGAMAGGIGWIFGTLIASQSQLLKATLDAAVHTSPFIDDKVRARIMSL